ncbi:hypothetical protein Dimus_032068, partial [Dionaea muscipula]
GLRNHSRTMVDATAGGSFMRKTTQAAWAILEDMVASGCQYTTDRPTVASTSPSEETITNILQLDSITQLSSQIEMLNKNFANMGLVAAVNPSGTCQGANPSEEQCLIKEQMQYIESPNHEEEAVNYVNPQWGDNNNQRWKQSNQPNRNYQGSSWKTNNQPIGQLANQNSNRPPGALPNNTEMNPRDVKAITLRSGVSYPEPRENHVLANSESSTSWPPKKRKMKRSTSGKGVDAEPESKKNSAPRTTKEHDIPDTEIPRPDLVSSSRKRNLVPTKEKVRDKEFPSQHINLTQLPYPQAARKTL